MPPDPRDERERVEKAEVGGEAEEDGADAEDAPRDEQQRGRAHVLQELAGQKGAGATAGRRSG